MSIVRRTDCQQFNEDLVAMHQQQALQRYVNRTCERENTANELTFKCPIQVETPERAALRTSIIDPRDGLAIERIIGENDLFPISYLEGGLLAARPVCRIEVRDRIGRVLGHGTGFLVTPHLLLTNNHVLENEERALFSLAQFNYELDIHMKERPVQSFRFNPSAIFITDRKLDFTLVAVEEKSADGTMLESYGYLPLLSQKGKALAGECVSIIQHPSGAPKAIALRENKITDIFEDYFHYSTDTKEGSSGSPVFNDEWTIVGLHHAGVPDPQNPSEYIANEGIRIGSILKHVHGQYSRFSKEQQVMLDILLEGWKEEEPDTVNAYEKLHVEELDASWYKDAAGYAADFLGENYAIPLASFRPDLESDLVPLLDQSGHVLNYTHFSIVMSKSRRLAYYTAVNIDGNQLVDVERGSDKWIYDSRIDRNYQCGPELYSDNLLDRGHLVRRRDPVWGEAAEAANVDTFHFTNCAPQHKNLNQQSWLDLENYILTNADNHKLQVSVFTGPVFRGDDIVYRGVQIPAEFWKIVVMVKKDGQLSATAYLQTQKNLIINLDFAYGGYRTYQVAITTIESLTGLDFGELRQYDPIGNTEAFGHVIDSAKDIRL